MTGEVTTCEHPLDAVRWDKHRALLRCTACGRDVALDYQQLLLDEQQSEVEDDPSPLP